MALSARQQGHVQQIKLEKGAEQELAAQREREAREAQQASAVAQAEAAELRSKLEQEQRELAAVTADGSSTAEAIRVLPSSVEGAGAGAGSGWACGTCTFVNPQKSKACQMCQMCQVSQSAGSGATGKRKRAGASGAGSSRGLPHEPSSLAAALSAQQRGHVQKIKQEKVEMQAQCEQTAALVAQRELEAREA